MLLFHINIWWLSKGNVTNQRFKIRGNLKLFFKEHRTTEFVIGRRIKIICLAYLVDIFKLFNKFNIQMYGRSINLIKHTAS